MNLHGEDVSGPYTANGRIPKVLNLIFLLPQAIED